MFLVVIENLRAFKDIFKHVEYFFPSIEDNEQLNFFYPFSGQLI
jgi:hypothetical protein